MTTAVEVVAVEVGAVEVVGAVAGVSRCSSATCRMTPGIIVVYCQSVKPYSAPPLPQPLPNLIRRLLTSSTEPMRLK